MPVQVNTGTTWGWRYVTRRTREVDEAGTHGWGRVEEEVF